MALPRVPRGPEGLFPIPLTGVVRWLTPVRMKGSVHFVPPAPAPVRCGFRLSPDYGGPAGGHHPADPPVAPPQAQFLQPPRYQMQPGHTDTRATFTGDAGGLFRKEEALHGLQGGCCPGTAVATRQAAPGSGGRSLCWSVRSCFWPLLMRIWRVAMSAASCRPAGTGDHIT